MQYHSLPKMSTLRISLIALAVASSLSGCNNENEDNEVTQSSYLEKYRPQLQYTPAKNWMNDPNGMVYHDGEYHLFYQYNPNGNGWGDMSWGHAVSTDKVHWEELPIALEVEKDENGAVTEMFFSGSAVVDTHNSSGLGTIENPAMVAMYTSYYPNAVTLTNGKEILAGTQAQSITYSLDKGRTWTQHAANPVIAKPPVTPVDYENEYREFRDPKVFWSEKHNKWVMVAVLATQHKAVLYESTNLVDWSFMSEFGPKNGVDGVWECPDLFEMAIDGDPDNKKWVMVINLNPGGPAGGSGSQYFIGDFDGTSFTADSESLYDNEPPIGTVTQDFESNYSAVNWTATGDLIDNYLATGNQPGQGGVAEYQGEQLLNTFVPVAGSGEVNGTDGSIGTITSPTFTINDKYLNLMVGGGKHPYDPEATLETEVPAGELLFTGADFEGAAGATYENLGWTATGDIIGQKVATGVIDDQLAVSGFMGTGLANTFFGALIGMPGDGPVGTLTSPDFTLHKPYINFLIAGGNHPYIEGKNDATAVLLMIDGQVVKSATGKDSETLNWTNWDVSEYQGQTAKIVLIDENSGGWGHINVDHFMASDQPAKPVSTETSVNLMVDGKVVHSATGPNSEKMGWRSWNVASLQGKQAQIRVVDNNTGGWGHIMVDHIMQASQPKQIANWADFGSDFYAAVSWNGVPDGKRLWVGWMSNWDYAGSTPTETWRSAQTFIRELNLQTINNKVQLTQTPVDTLASLRGNPLFTNSQALTISPTDTLLTDNNINAQVFEINSEINVDNADVVGFKVRTGNNGDVTIVAYDALAGEVYIDRTQSGDSSFSSSFAAKHSAPIKLTENGKLALRIIVDTSSVTVFAGQGEVVLTDQIFPDPGSTGMEVFSEGDNASIESLTIWPLKSIWADK